MAEELALGEEMAAVETPIDDDKPMSKANKRMLLAILGAEFLWFMSDNALGTYIGNYVIYYLNSVSSATMILTILGGLASVIGFATAGSIAEKIGRFTGYYYAASMSAQTITPVALGFVLDATMAWRTLPVYASILTAASFLVFTLLVKNIKAKKVDHVKGLDALGADD